MGVLSFALAKQDSSLTFRLGDYRIQYVCGVHLDGMPILALEVEVVPLAVHAVVVLAVVPVGVLAPVELE